MASSNGELNKDNKHFLEYIISETELIEKDLDKINFHDIDPELLQIFLQKIEQLDDNFIENIPEKDIDIFLIFKTINKTSKNLFFPCKQNWTATSVKQQISEYYKFPTDYMTIVANDEIMPENITMSDLNTDTLYVILTTKFAHPYRDNFTVGEVRETQKRLIELGNLNVNDYGTSVDPVIKADGTDKCCSMDSFQSMEDDSPSPTKKMFLDLNSQMDID